MAQLAGDKGVSLVRREREDEAVTDRCCLEVRVGLGVRIGGVEQMDADGGGEGGRPRGCLASHVPRTGR